jgi:RNA polymerase sigma-70 factor (ECF subfamily)
LFFKKKTTFAANFFITILFQVSKDINDIIEGLLQDSSQAMKHLFDMFYKPLCCYAVRYVSSMSIAEEIASDVMLKIWQNRHHSCYRAETFREYLFTATRNTALNYLKQQQNRRKLSDNWAEQFRDELIEETPLDTMISKETQSKVESLMETLPEQCRKVFLMSRMDDMSYEEIAIQTGISVNTVKYHIKTALHKLRDGIGNSLMLLLLFLKFFGVSLMHTPTLLLVLTVIMVIFCLPFN